MQTLFRDQKENKQNIYEAPEILNDITLEIRLLELEKHSRSFFEFQKKASRWITEGSTRLIFNQGLNEKSEIVMSFPHAETAGTIIICSYDDITDWEEEIQLWRPELTVQTFWKKKNCRYPEPGEVLIVPWSILSDSFDIEGFHEFMIVVSEADTVKNLKSKRVKNLIKLSRMAQSRVFLTQKQLRTPKEIFTLLSVMDTLDLLEVDSLKDFRREFFDKEGRRFVPNISLKEFFLTFTKYRSFEDCSRYPPIKIEDRYINVLYEKEKSLKKIKNQELLEELSSLKWPSVQGIVNTFVMAQEPLVLLTDSKKILNAISKNKEWAIISEDVPSDKRNFLLSKFKAKKIKYLIVTPKVMTGLTIDDSYSCLTFLRINPVLDREVNHYIIEKLKKMAARRSQKKVRPIHVINMKAYCPVDLSLWEKFNGSRN